MGPSVRQCHTAEQTKKGEPFDGTQRGTQRFLGFDLRYGFTNFITIKIVQLLYWLALIINALSALAVFIVLARTGGAGVIVGLILAPIMFIILMIFSRVYLELIIVFFKIADSTAKMAGAGTTPMVPEQPQPGTAPMVAGEQPGS